MNRTYRLSLVWLFGLSLASCKTNPQPTITAAAPSQPLSQRLAWLPTPQAIARFEGAGAPLLHYLSTEMRLNDAACWRALLPRVTSSYMVEFPGSAKSLSLLEGSFTRTEVEACLTSASATHHELRAQLSRAGSVTYAAIATARGNQPLGTAALLWHDRQIVGASADEILALQHQPAGDWRCLAPALDSLPTAPVTYASCNALWTNLLGVATERWLGVATERWQLVLTEFGQMRFAGYVELHYATTTRAAEALAALQRVQQANGASPALPLLAEFMRLPMSALKPELRGVVVRISLPTGQFMALPAAGHNSGA